MMPILSGIGIFGALLMTFVLLLWIFMPFAVFGIKDLAKSLIADQRRLIALQEKTNALLEQSMASKQ
jgi:hypothetical protein